MKCPNCNHGNLQGSRFCEQCGFKLGVKVSSKVQKPHRILQEVEEGIEDILFKPKKKKHSWGWILLIGAVVLIIVFLIIKTSDSNTVSGSNNSVTDVPTPLPTPYFDPSCLKLNGSKVSGNSYYVPNPTFEGSIYNGCYRAVKNVIMKINFYKYGATRNDIPLDTQYVNLVDYLAPQDSKTVKGTVNTAVDTSGSFSWTTDIYSAEPF